MKENEHVCKYILKPFFAYKNDAELMKNPASQNKLYGYIGKRYKAFINAVLITFLLHFRLRHPHLASSCIGEL